MSDNKLPANISILELTPERLKAIRPVKVLDIYDGGTENFHPDGLFSIETFGRLGSEDRTTRFGFIDIKLQILHPFLFKAICKLKSLYKGILNGSEYAVWDEKEKDFVASNMIDGETGYGFFIKHWSSINFKQTASKKRDLRIDMVYKYRDKALTSKVLVMPAGLRDAHKDETGRTKEDEVNEFYRKLISASNAVQAIKDPNDPIYDNTRVSMQNAFNALYDYIDSLLGGKNGYMLQQWAARRVFNGVRNVITAMDTSTPVLGSRNAPSINHTGIGFFQFMKGALPLVQHHMLKFLAGIFTPSTGTAMLIDKLTLQPVQVKVKSKIIERWTTPAGIEKLINRFESRDTRKQHVEINDHYLALIYDDGKHFKIFRDIRELPEGFDKSLVRPLTYIEMFYLSGYNEWNKLPMLVTRYPVTGDGSIYHSWTYVYTTTKGLCKRQMGNDWQPLQGDEYEALEFPNLDIDTFVDSLIPHPSRLAGLGGDFDGDTASCTILYSIEAIAEATLYLKLRKAYVNPFGGYKASPITETVERVLADMTGE